MEAGTEWTPPLIKGFRASDCAKIDQWLEERVFVSCAIDDDLSYVINKAGDDFVVRAMDFPHGDAFRQDQLANGLKAHGDLSDQTIEKILCANPQRFYHF